MSLVATPCDTFRANAELRRIRQIFTRFLHARDEFLHVSYAPIPKVRPFPQADRTDGFLLPVRTRAPDWRDRGIPAPVHAPGVTRMICVYTAIGVMTLTLAGIYFALSIGKPRP